eukprot:Hpha_TRINITY_DN8898_c0_g1::TRINITY_DN8898_c0_g1_i1::g.141660::m.141660
MFEGKVVGLPVGRVQVDVPGLGDDMEWDRVLLVSLPRDVQEGDEGLVPRWRADELRRQFYGDPVPPLADLLAAQQPAQAAVEPPAPPPMPVPPAAAEPMPEAAIAAAAEERPPTSSFASTLRPWAAEASPERDQQRLLAEEFRKRQAGSFASPESTADDAVPTSAAADVQQPSQVVPPVSDLAAPAEVAAPAPDVAVPAPEAAAAEAELAAPGQSGTEGPSGAEANAAPATPPDAEDEPARPMARRPQRKGRKAPTSASLATLAAQAGAGDD